MSQRTVFSMLDRATVQYAADPYLSTKTNLGWKRTSFSDAKIKARRLASAFLELGIKTGDKISILSEAKTDWIIAEFAALTGKEISKDEARRNGCATYIPKSNLQKVVSMAKILFNAKPSPSVS